MTWEPSRYLKFSGERQQPALDLMAAIDLEEPKNIVDLDVALEAMRQSCGSAFQMFG